MEGVFCRAVFPYCPIFIFTSSKVACRVFFDALHASDTFKEQFACSIYTQAWACPSGFWGQTACPVPGEVGSGPAIDWGHHLACFLFCLVKGDSASAYWLFSRFDPPHSPVDQEIHCGSVPSVTCHCFCISGFRAMKPQIGQQPWSWKMYCFTCVQLLACFCIWRFLLLFLWAPGALQGWGGVPIPGFPPCVARFPGSLAPPWLIPVPPRPCLPQSTSKA